MNISLSSAQRELTCEAFTLTPLDESGPACPAGSLLLTAAMQSFLLRGKLLMH